MFELRVIIAFAVITIVKSLENSNKLLIVSFDGFRYDYIDRKLTPNMHTLKTKSTSAKFLINVFPTQTFPNHFSIATGLYSENHGVLASEVFDSKKGELVKYGYELWHYNESVLPIWTLNEKAGRHSGVMMWPGSEFDFAGIKTTHSAKYNSSWLWEDRVNEILNWFLDKKKPANLVMSYFEQPDKDSHAFGPDSPQTNLQIRKVDGIVNYIVDQLIAKDLTDLNVIFLSDHGMEGVTVDRIIDLRPIVGNISNMYGTSPVLQVHPHKGKDEEVYLKLKQFSLKNKHFAVYKHDNIPEELHYKKCTRSPPIMVLAAPKYAFHDLYEGIKWYKEHYENVTDENTFGVHGYDPKTIDMHPYFIAYGPMFKQNYEADHLYTVDLYLLFAKILNLKPIFADGDIKRVHNVFKSPSLSRQIALIVGLLLLFMGVIIAFVAIYFRRKRKKHRVLLKEDINDKREIHALLEQA